MTEKKEAARVGAVKFENKLESLLAREEYQENELRDLLKKVDVALGEYLYIDFQS